MIRSIPPNTAMRSTMPPTVGKYYKAKTTEYKKSTYSKPKGVMPPYTNENMGARDISLDMFDEKDELKVVGDFPGVEDINDILIDISNDTLWLVTKPTSTKNYEATVKLPEAYRTLIKNRDLRNSIMTVVLEQVKFEEVHEDLLIVFNKCLESYPEIEDVELKVVKSDRDGTSDSLEGAKGKVDGKDVVILFIPNKVWGFWNIFKPVIHHELCHFIDLDNPDKVFYERADKKSIKVWDMLKKDKLVDCKVE
jgi:HSP20 family molecular chaperone IbpA